MSNNPARILTALAFLLSPALARQHTDVIVMANGDRLTGEIKGLSGGVLRFDVGYVDGALSVQWMKVARVESSQLFIVQAQDGRIYTGTLSTAPSQTRQIEVAAGPEAKTLIDQSQVVRLDETSETFLRRFSGEVTLGAVYSKGNNATQYNLGSDVEYRRPRWGAQATVSSNLSANSGSNTSTRNELGFNGYRLLPWKNYYYGGLCDFLQSSVQGISLQTTVGGGIGRYLKNTNRARISLLGGLAWQKTKYEPSTVDVSTQQVAAGLIAGTLKLFVFKKTNLTLTGMVVPAVNDGGRVRYSTNTSYYLKLFRDLSWNFSFYGNWDTRPPGNFSGSDYGYSSGLKWTFGYR